VIGREGRDKRLLVSDWGILADDGAILVNGDTSSGVRRMEPIVNHVESERGSGNHLVGNISEMDLWVLELSLLFFLLVLRFELRVSHLLGGALPLESSKSLFCVYVR
jgi:hypothetical protein